MTRKVLTVFDVGPSKTLQRLIMEKEIYDFSAIDAVKFCTKEDLYRQMIQTVLDQETQPIAKRLQLTSGVLQTENVHPEIPTGLFVNAVKALAPTTFFGRLRLTILKALI